MSYCVRRRLAAGAAFVVLSAIPATAQTNLSGVWNNLGTYYQLAAPTAQLPINGGNVQVKP